MIKFNFHYFFIETTKAVLTFFPPNGILYYTKVKK